MNFEMAQKFKTSNEDRRPPPPPPLPPLPPLLHNRKIQKVPELLLEEKHNTVNYIPKVVSIGPYHHGKQQFRLVESFKPMALNLIVSGNKVKEAEYCQEIKKRISHIRKCYEEHSTDSYSDDELARMMLLDACFIIIHIETSCITKVPTGSQSNYEKMVRNYAGYMVRTCGMLTMSCVLRDMFLLENQIPLWVVKLLLSSRYQENQIQELLNRYLTISLFKEFRPNINLQIRYPQELHLLDAFHRLLAHDFVHQPKKTCLSFIKDKFLFCSNAKEKTDLQFGVSSQGKSRFQSCKNDLTAKACRRLFKNSNEGDDAKGNIEKFIHSFGSVTDLKANGIHFRPSQTLSLKDVQFESNCIYAQLQLPFWCVSVFTKVFFLNMIADELSLKNVAQAVVIAYINLMKSLIVKPEDVKELREKKILLCPLGNDIQILKVYQDINTYGADSPSIFQNVKDEIQAHYNSRMKTWIAEFLHTHFRSPWSVITLIAAICILVFTILQTVYTMICYLKDK